MHIQPEHTWNVYILRKTIQLSHSISRADWQGNFSLIKNFDETGMSALVHAALTGTGSSLNQVPHDVFRGKEENVSWNLSRDLACILEHISCYENCWNTFKWASHNCPWELSCQLEVTQTEPPKVEKPEIGRGGEGGASNLGILSVIRNGSLVPTAWSSYNLFSAIVTDPGRYSG